MTLPKWSVPMLSLLVASCAARAPTPKSSVLLIGFECVSWDTYMLKAEPEDRRAHIPPKPLPPPAPRPPPPGPSVVSYRVDPITYGIAKCPAAK